MDNFERDFLSKLGLDTEDPWVRAAADDAQTHARIIETLTQVRTDRDMTQTAVARRMGTTQSRVSNFERIGGDPRLSTLLRYARAVDTKLRISASPAPRGWAPVDHEVFPTMVGTEMGYAPDAAWEQVPA